jgi:hypothetical protein
VGAVLILPYDVQIGSNFVFVDSSQTGLTRAQNITLYGLSGGFSNPVILRDGLSCPSGMCSNFTSLNDATVSFIVSSWSNYSIGENPTELVSCGDINRVNTIYTLVQDISTGGDCFNISANNITLDLAGHTVSGDTSNRGTGVRILSYMNFTTVKNGALVGFGSGVTGDPVGGSLITNLTLQTSGSFGFCVEEL